MNAKTPFKIEEFYFTEEPYYEAIGDEIALFEASYHNQLPVLIKGPTGCGKTRFMEHIAWRLKRPLITVACHDDLTTADLVGRYLLKGGETIWTDGPLTRAVRHGCLCYLDEIVEARKDTTVILHPICDHRRILPIDKLGEAISASDGFGITVSYNPGYQSILKDLKQSTRQRFVSLEFDYPPSEIEQKIICYESKIEEETARGLIKFAALTRNLKGNGLTEGASTRLLVHAAKLIQSGIATSLAARSAISEVLTDEPEMLRSLDELSNSVF